MWVLAEAHFVPHRSHLAVHPYVMFLYCVSMKFHRTVTLDYRIVMRCSITLILDNNKRVKLNGGDVIVQRGTIHGWYNDSDEWTHMFFVMIRK